MVLWQYLPFILKKNKWRAQKRWGNGDINFTKLGNYTIFPRKIDATPFSKSHCRLKVSPHHGLLELSFLSFFLSLESGGKTLIASLSSATGDYSG